MTKFSIIKGPIVTEKAHRLIEEGNKYTFEVTRGATKGAIKRAVEELYGVRVLGVNLLRTRGRRKRSIVNRRYSYNTRDVKKAVVKLDPKDSIKLFEGAK